MSNKRTGWEICQEIINAQDLINAQVINKTNMAYKVKKRTGWEIFPKLINAQCLISSHRTDFFLKKINAHVLLLGRSEEYFLSILNFPKMSRTFKYIIPSLNSYLTNRVGRYKLPDQISAQGAEK